MKLKKCILSLGILFVIPICISQNKTIWQIGNDDDSSKEFALADGKYTEFLERDFGWEDRSFVIGHSLENEDFPFVLPGAYDYWGGTSGLAGIRPHELNLLFTIRNKPDSGQWLLIVDLLDCSPEDPPFVKISINGMFSGKKE